MLHVARTTTRKLQRRAYEGKKVSLKCLLQILVKFYIEFQRSRDGKAKVHDALRQILALCETVQIRFAFQTEQHNIRKLSPSPVRARKYRIRESAAASEDLFNNVASSPSLVRTFLPTHTNTRAFAARASTRERKAKSSDEYAVLEMHSPSKQKTALAHSLASGRDAGRRCCYTASIHTRSRVLQAYMLLREACFESRQTKTAQTLKFFWPQSSTARHPERGTQKTK